ncbi:hypothetical protein [Halorhabdus salina]|uniref:hypothetical protein n=1 Tax=Halorhabdus salina TaxID=2750670 RepID=UPI0015EE5AF8|nr:hypothetical protein [Halorhabdus salina]
MGTPTSEHAKNGTDGTVQLNPSGVPIPAAPNPPATLVIQTTTGSTDAFELRWGRRH